MYHPEYDLVYSQPDSQGRPLILILGEDSINLKLLEDMLHNLGYDSQRQARRNLLLDTLLYRKPDLLLVLSWEEPPCLTEIITKIHAHDALKNIMIVVIGERPEALSSEESASKAHFIPATTSSKQLAIELKHFLIKRK